MKLSLAGSSLLLFGVSVVLWLVLTLFESALIGLPIGTERSITFLALVLPAGIGALLGAISLLRNEGKLWLAVAGMILNILFASFHLLVILFAG